jgi:hypothetical protein
VVPYPHQIYYFLHRNYIIDGEALAHPERYRGGYLLDLDLSQLLNREPANRRGDYSLPAPPPSLQKVFEGPDARIYRFVK